MRVRARAVPSWAVITAAVLLSACGGDSTGPKVVDISGVNWQMSANISNSSLGVSCQAAGYVSISQSGSNFTGEVTGSTEVCTGPGGTASGSIDGPLTGGQVSGSSATYSDGSCDYTGTISGSPSNRVSGTVTCMVPIQGTNYPFSGTFLISR